MLKITLLVQENKENQNCVVKLVTPKDLSKATENEKNSACMVINQVTKALQEIQD